MGASQNQAEVREITGLAEAYLDRSAEELEVLLEEAVDEAESKGPPHRGVGDREFWRGAAQRLRKEIAQQKLSASATAGTLAGMAIEWAHEVGLDMTDFKVPIAILVALVVKSLWEQMDGGGPEQGGKGTDDSGKSSP